MLLAGLEPGTSPFSPFLAKRSIISYSRGGFPPASFELAGLNNQRKQQNNKNKITLWKPKEHCVQFAVVMYEKKKKKRGERAKGHEGSGRHRRGGSKLALLPPIFELKIILEEP